MPQFERVNTQSVADSVSNQLKHLILGGGLKPGEKLPSERSLSAEFNVARMSLRQGIARLIDVGLLEAHKDGTYVCDVISPSLIEPFSQLLNWYPKAWTDMQSLRLLLETEAVKLACQRHCDADKKTLRLFFEKTQKAFEGKDDRLLMQAIDAMHMAIVDCSYNIVLSTLLRGILSILQTHGAQQASILDREDLQFIQERLYYAVIQGDETTALRMLSRHIDTIKEAYSKTVSDQDKSSYDIENQSNSYRIDKTRARIEHLLICQHFDLTKPLPQADQLAKDVDENVDIVSAALQAMQSSGSLQFEEGHYKTLNSSAEPLITDPLVHLMQTDARVAYDILELRIIVEKSSAYQAAQNHDAEKRRYLKTCLNRLLDDGDEYNAHNNALDDYEYHLAIADMSGNLAITYLMRGLFNLLRGSISNWLVLFNKEVGDISIIENQHIQICDTILANNADGASQAMYDHLHYVVNTMQNIEARRERAQFAEQRWRYIANKHRVTP